MPVSGAAGLRVSLTRSPGMQTDAGGADRFFQVRCKIMQHFLNRIVTPSLAQLANAFID
jgi:hypothetical protein